MSDDDPTGRWTASWCPQCGPDVAVDEDGCCATCGATATGTAATHAVVLLRILEFDQDDLRLWKALVEIAAASRCDGCRSGWVYSGGKHAQPPERAFVFECRAGFLGDVLAELRGVRAFVLPSAVRVSSTCAYLRDGTKVVVRREPGCAHAVKLEVVPQAVIRVATGPVNENHGGES